MPYACCDHCIEDPVYHLENPPDSHDVSCSTSPLHPCLSGGDRYIAESKEQDR